MGMNHMTFLWTAQQKPDTFKSTGLPIVKVNTKVTSIR